jgi:hypothetical protein
VRLGGARTIPTDNGTDKYAGQSPGDQQPTSSHGATGAASAGRVDGTIRGKGGKWVTFSRREGVAAFKIACTDEKGASQLIFKYSILVEDAIAADPEIIIDK